MSPSSLTLDEKRRAVYASLMRFAPEALPLRDRALRRLLLSALLGSSAVDPYRIGRIREHLAFGSESGGIRTEVVQGVLDDLINDGTVGQTLLRERHAYYLTEAGDNEIATAVVTAEQLIGDVLEVLLRDTRPFLAADVAAAVFKRFIFECFARFGRTIARQVTGTISAQELVRSVDARAAFEAAVAEQEISPEQRQSLEARFIAFLRSSAPPDERLKFFLTQGYYFAQLLGIENAEFNPIAEEAFAGAVMYLDTNVLVTGVLIGEEAAGEFFEVLNLARRIGVEVRVSGATLNELLRITNDRAAELERIVAVVPTALAQKTNDQILEAFLRKQNENPYLTPSEFLAPAYALRSRLIDEWPVVFDDRTEIEMIGDRDSSEIEAVMDEEAQRSRGWGKSPTVAKHDAAHYFAINDLRRERRKAWFLTRDNSLAGVAARVQPQEAPFYIPHLGFLQSISPFVTTADQERSFAEVFSDFLSDQVRPIETLFDMRELALMAEFHEDVMATPPEQLVMAFDFVKNRTLHGKRYKAQDMPRVALELRKFLSADKDEQLRTLREERERVSEEARQERELRKAAERARDTEADRRGALEEEVGDLRSELDSVRSQLDADRAVLSAHFVEQRRGLERRRSIVRAASALLGLGAGLLLWHYRDRIASTIQNASGAGPVLLIGVEVVIAIVAVAIFTGPSVFFIRRTEWRKDTKVAALAVLIAVSLWLGDVMAPESISGWADRIGIATLIAVAAGGLLVQSNEG